MEVIGQLHVPADEMALEAGRTSLALRTTLSLSSYARNRISIPW